MGPKASEAHLGWFAGHYPQKPSQLIDGALEHKAMVLKNSTMQRIHKRSLNPSQWPMHLVLLIRLEW